MSHEGTFVYVKAYPSSKKEKFLELGENNFEAYVREPAQHNLANIRVRELTAHHFGVPVQRVTMTTGHRSRKKTLIVS